MNEIELQPFRKQNWKNVESKEKWGDDLIAVREGLKQVRWKAVSDDEHPKQIAVIPLDGTDAGEWLDRVSDNQLAVSKEEDWEFDDYGRKNGDAVILAEDYQILGEFIETHDNSLRGYPDCCMEFHEQFEKRDPTYEIAENSESATEVDGKVHVQDPHHITNVMWRYLGWSFLDFLPCSFDCDSAYEYGSETGRLLREQGYGDEGESLFKFLAKPAHWSGYHALAHVINGYCIGSYYTSDYYDKKEFVWIEEHEKEKQ